jgi:hypothetical protein
MNSVKALLIIQIRMACVDLFRRIYHHERIAARAYRAFADRHLDNPHRSVILMLADIADRKAQHYAMRLSRLGSTLTPGYENWVDRLWYWLLVHAGINFTFQWIEWVEERDNSKLVRQIYEYDSWHKANLKI